jgi:hypothetical protein
VVAAPRQFHRRPTIVAKLTVAGTQWTALHTYRGSRGAVKPRCTATASAVPANSHIQGHIMGLGISPGGFGGPQGIMSTQDFQKGLKSESTENLVKMLGNSNLPPAAKEMIGKELEQRMNAEAAKGAEGGGGESEGEGDDLKKLLKKLQDGTISPEELKKLGSMLGVDPAKLEKAVGKGAEGEQDIQGG